MTHSEERETPTPTPAPVDRVAPILFSLSFACFAFVCILFGYRHGGIVEKEEFKIFALAWLTIPAITIALLRLAGRPLATYFGDSPDVRSIALLAHAAFWGRFVVLFHHAFPSGSVSLVIDELGPPLLDQIKIFCAGNVVILVAARALHHFVPFEQADPKTQRNARRVRLAVDFALPFVICCYAVPFNNRTLPPFTPYIVAALLGIAMLAFGEGDTSSGASVVMTPALRRARIAKTVLFVLLLVLVSYDPFPDVHTASHYYYLGAVAAVMAGKSLLVTVNCQYGVVVIYFIAFLMQKHVIAASYTGLAHLLAALLVLHFLLCHWILRVATRSFVVATATTFLLVLVVQYGQLEFPSEFPSVGPLRFGFGWLFVASLALEARYPRRTSLAAAIPPIAIGLASVWSFESFTYVFVAYAGVLVFDALHVASRAELLRLWRRIVPVLACVAFAHGVLALSTFGRSRHWPNWKMYFAYILLYSREEFGTMLIPTWSPWAIIVGVYLLSVLSLGYRRFSLGRRSLTGGNLEPRLLFGMTALGIAQYTYFLGRSHLNNLFHVATPAIMLAACWIAWLAKRPAGASKAFRIATIYASVAGAFFLAFTCVPDFLGKYDHTLMSLVTSPRPVEPIPDNPRGRDAAMLMTKLAATRRKVVLFTESDAEVDAFLRSGKAQIWPISYPPADIILPSANDAILEFVSPLREEDIIYLDISSSPRDMRLRPGEILDAPQLSHDVSDVERTVFAQIASHYAFRVIEQTPSGIVAVRLLRRRS